MEVREEVTHRTPDQFVTRRVVQETEYLSDAELNDEKVARTNYIVWYIVGIIEAVLALRVIFELLGARNVSFVSALYQLTNPLVLPLHGIFPTPVGVNSFVDVAALVTIVVIALIGWAVSTLIEAFATPPRHVIR